MVIFCAVVRVDCKTIILSKSTDSDRFNVLL